MKKTKELTFLKKLEKYFKNVPAETIDQKESCIYNCIYDNCGCFGAHIAKMEGHISKIQMEQKGIKVYYYEDGEKIFRNNVSPQVRQLFLKKIRPKSEDDSQIFSTEDWDEHPYKVITRVIEDLEK